MNELRMNNSIFEDIKYIDDEKGNIGVNEN